jgi:hypothetical protein
MGIFYALKKGGKTLVTHLNHFLIPRIFECNVRSGYKCWIGKQIPCCTARFSYRPPPPHFETCAQTQPTTRYQIFIIQHLSKSQIDNIQNSVKLCVSIPLLGTQVRVMSLVAIRWPVNTDRRVQSRAIPCGLCGGQSGKAVCVKWFQLQLCQYRPHV